MPQIHFVQLSVLENAIIQNMTILLSVCKPIFKYYLYRPNLGYEGVYTLSSVW